MVFAVPLSIEFQLIGEIGITLNIAKITKGDSKGVAIYTGATPAPSAPTTKAPTVGPVSCANSKSSGIGPFSVVATPYAKGTLKVMAGVNLVAVQAGIGASVSSSLTDN